MNKGFFIEFYVYHNHQIWAKLVGLRARHPLRFTMLCSCVTASTLLLNNYWADGQHKVPGIKCSHTGNLHKEERINQIRQEVYCYMNFYVRTCKTVDPHSDVAVIHSVTRVACPRFQLVPFDSLPNNGLTKVSKVSLTA